MINAFDFAMCKVMQTYPRPVNCYINHVKLCNQRLRVVYWWAQTVYISVSNCMNSEGYMTDRKRIPRGKRPGHVRSGDDFRI